MSRNAARFLVLIFILSGLYGWWLVSWSFYEGHDLLGRTAVDDGCGSFHREIPLELTQCCNERDRTYFDGGTLDQKKVIDGAFDHCIWRHRDTLSTQSKMIFWSQKVVSAPFIHTPWRWGYGWPYGKGYR